MSDQKATSDELKLQDRIDKFMAMITQSYPKGVSADELFDKYEVKSNELERLRLEPRIFAMHNDEQKCDVFYYVPPYEELIPELPELTEKYKKLPFTLKIDADIKELWFRVGAEMKAARERISADIERETQRIEVEKSKAVNVDKKRRKSAKRKITNGHLVSKPEFSFLLE